ncbi:MAG: hypothetical protein O2834_02965 [Crenarchaeota archaeon]|nr:hypothetical protein [Thermoproteota archaeon]HJJ22064.1 hypothetical protein [Nitrosopumilus sp.]MDA0854232.1 hypothetical protein [Thermoproteota archaeon]MDA1123177.1 hypothetical protein [Thermoproteota archaeon]HJJ24882.1 hypothetical protein [Nitrosopumilus sp.]
MIGLGIFFGALTAGFLSNATNYVVSFVVAAILIILALVMFRIFMKYRLSHKSI